MTTEKLTRVHQPIQQQMVEPSGNSFVAAAKLFPLTAGTSISFSVCAFVCAHLPAYLTEDICLIKHSPTGGQKDKRRHFPGLYVYLLKITLVADLKPSDELQKI